MHAYKGELQFDFIGTDSYAIVNSKMQIVGLFAQRDVNKLIDKKQNWVRLRGKNG